MYALRASPVVFGPVRCGVSDENTTAPPAATGAGTAPGRVAEAFEPERLDVRVRKRSQAMHTRCDNGTAVGFGGVGEREPDRQVLLRLDERVAVVLMPREPPRLLGLLVDGLIPVEVDVGAEQIRAPAR